jgi:RNA polymerase sigma factor (sigma-70 family)
VTPLVSATLLRTQSDGRLVALAAEGHERAFEAIVERYRKPLHRFCRRVLPEARAEDAVQQTFLKAWTALGNGTQVEDLRAWLYRIARNAALDGAKKAGYDYDELTESLRMAPGVDEDLERRAIIRETLTGVATLPENQREALLRTAVDGQSRAQIARDLHITEGAVRQLVHRARTTLRAAATVLTPLPFASWAAAFGGTPAADAPQRIAEVAAGAGSAGSASVLLKAGTAVVAAGVLAAGPPGTALRHAVERDGAGPPDAQAAPAPGEDGSGHREGAQGDSHRRGHGEARGQGHGRGAHGRHAAGDDTASHRSGTSDDQTSGDDRRSGFSGSGSGSSGSGSSGSGSGDGHSGSGSAGSTSSGPGGGGSDNSGPGSTSSGSGSGSSGSDGVISGSSGSGSSGSGDDGVSGSSSSGPGSGETTTTSTTESSNSGPGDGLTSDSTPDGPH